MSQIKTGQPGAQSVALERGPGKDPPQDYYGGKPYLASTKRTRDLSVTYRHLMGAAWLLFESNKENIHDFQKLVKITPYTKNPYLVCFNLLASFELRPCSYRLYKT